MRKPKPPMHQINRQPKRILLRPHERLKDHLSPPSPNPEAEDWPYTPRSSMEPYRILTTVPATPLTLSSLPAPDIGIKTTSPSPKFKLCGKGRRENSKRASGCRLHSSARQGSKHNSPSSDQPAQSGPPTAVPSATFRLSYTTGRPSVFLPILLRPLALDLALDHQPTSTLATLCGSWRQTSERDVYLRSERRMGLNPLTLKGAVPLLVVEFQLGKGGESEARTTLLGLVRMLALILSSLLLHTLCHTGLPRTLDLPHTSPQTRISPTESAAPSSFTTRVLLSLHLRVGSARWAGARKGFALGVILCRILVT
ncbi:hypothetical protein H0H92_010191 [Tricholoma furcatifolium]|nr:hypothetical protein H0H92_010191 [Tricholoma furcatifolium]